MGPEWLVIGAVVAVLFGGVGAAAFGASRAARSYQDHMEARWAKAAEAIGGHLEVVARKSLEPRVLRLIVERDEATAVAILSVPVSANVIAHTKARARYVLGVGPSFVVRPRLVHEPAEDGMPRSVRTASGASRAAFTPEVMALVDQVNRPLTIRSDGEEIDVLWDGVEDDARVLDLTLKLVAAIARHGADHLRGLSTIDDATYEAQSDEGPRVRVRRGNVDVRIAVRAGESEPIYVARVDAREGTPEASARVREDGTLSRVLPDGLLAPDVEADLPRVAPARLRSTGAHLELEWEEAPSLDQARAAVAILSAVGASRGTQGAFR